MAILLYKITISCRHFFEVVWRQCHVPGVSCSELSRSCVHPRSDSEGEAHCSISKVSDLYGSCSPVCRSECPAPCLTADKHMLFLSQCIYGLTHNSISATWTIQGYKEVFMRHFSKSIKQSDYFSNAQPDMMTSAGVCQLRSKLPTAEPFSRTKCWNSFKISNFSFFWCVRSLNKRGLRITFNSCLIFEISPLRHSSTLGGV